MSLIVKVSDHLSIRHRPYRRQTVATGVVLVVMLLVALHTFLGEHSIKDLARWYQPSTEIAQPHPPAWTIDQPAASELLPDFVLSSASYRDFAPVVTEPPFTAYDPVAPKEPGMVVPDIVHYVWLDANDDLYLTFSQYLAMRSVIVRQRPAKLYFHCNLEPKGKWWQAIRDQVTVNHVEVPESVYGHTLKEYAHRSDILRLLILQEMGGIYVDADIFLLDDLMYAPFTMGQAWPGCLWSSIMIAAPHAAFLDRYRDLYLYFNPDDWMETSSVRPADVAAIHPDEIQLVDPRGFFSPDANHNEIYEPGNDGYDFFATGQYTYHGWNHFTGWHTLEQINPRDVLAVDTSFNKMVRELVTEEDVAIWDSLDDAEQYKDASHAR